MPTTPKHRATNVRAVHTYPDGAVQVQFDCTRTCGMTGDVTVGDDLAAATAAADRICADHRWTAHERISPFSKRAV